jgi:hypothetical protein
VFLVHAQIARSGLGVLALSRTERRGSQQSTGAQNRRYVCRGHAHICADLCAEVGSTGRRSGASFCTATESADRQFGAGVLRPKLAQPSFDIVQVMDRVVQRMFEKSPDRVVVVANGDPTPPHVRASGGGLVSKTESLAVEVLDDRVGIFVAVGSRSSVDQLGAIDRWIRRFVVVERLLDAKDVQGRDIAAVSCVFKC